MPRLVITYADDTLIFVKGNDHSEAAAQLTKAMVKVSTWLNNCHLQFDTFQTVAMFFLSKHRNQTQNLTSQFSFLGRKSKL